MITIALRFAEIFAPETGTIAEHDRIISQIGYVWYGKLGAAISKKVVEYIFQNEDPKILLIHSGKSERYWAHIDNIQNETPEKLMIPAYYRDKTSGFKSWFRVTRFEAAPNNVLSKCKVVSSQRLLSEVSRSSMNPYFIIELDEKL